jgi:hypothetical protein
MQSKNIMRVLEYLLATIFGKNPIFIGLIKKEGGS